MNNPDAEMEYLDDTLTDLFLLVRSSIEHLVERITDPDELWGMANELAEPFNERIAVLDARREASNGRKKSVV